MIAEAPVNGTRVIDPQTALLDRKLKLSADLNCRELLGELETADGNIAFLFKGRLEADAQLQAAKSAVDEAETIAALGAVCDGKNEPERKLQRERAVQEDAGYRESVAALRKAETQLAQYDADLDSEKRRARRLEKSIEYRTAALRFLGG